MAELSADELKRLARDFLVGRGGEAELEDTKRAMDAGLQLAGAMLQEMQAALDETATAGFSPDQWKEVDTRVAALIQPLAKSAFGLGFLGKFFSGLFRKKPAPAASARIKRKGAPEPEAAPGEAAPASAAPSSLISAEPAVAASMPGSGSAEGLEEMAPIAPLSAAPQAAPAEAMAAPAAPAAEAAETAPAQPPRRSPAAPAAKGRSSKGLLAGVLALLFMLAAGWGAWRLYLLVQGRRKAVAPSPPPAALPQPSPTPHRGPPMRQLPQASQDEPLPSELPPMTPQPAGSVQGIPDLDAKDAQGRPGLPLP